MAVSDKTGHCKRSWNWLKRMLQRGLASVIRAAPVTDAGADQRSVTAYAGLAAGRIRTGVTDGSTASISGCCGSTNGSTGKRPLTGMKIVVDAGNGSGGFLCRRKCWLRWGRISQRKPVSGAGWHVSRTMRPIRKIREAMECHLLTGHKNRRRSGTHFRYGCRPVVGCGRARSVRYRTKQHRSHGSSALVSEDHPGTTVVTDSITSRQLTEFLENKLGLNHHALQKRI